MIPNKSIVLKSNKGSYQIFGDLGKGAEGVVHKAMNIKTLQQVAIKTIKQISDYESDCLIKLSQNQLTHIINVHDYFGNEQQAFIVMELAQNSYEKIIEFMERDKFKLPIQDKLNHLSQMAYGIHELHSIGLIHRDIKPGNFLQTFVNGQIQIKLADFGLVRQQMRLLTPHSHGNGTQKYMAKEQKGHENITQKVDIWAFGILFLELWTDTQIKSKKDVFYSLTTHILSQKEIDQKIEQIQSCIEIKLLLKDILKIEPSQRISALEIFTRLKNISTQQLQDNGSERQDYVKTKRGKYEFIQLLEIDSELKVFKARHQQSQMLFVLKIYKQITPTDCQKIEWLRQRKLKHFINIKDFDYSDGKYILIMDFSDGQFRNLIKNGFNNDDIMNYFIQIVQGVEEIHNIGMIHRDLNPDNVVYVEDKNIKILKINYTGLKRDKSEKTQNIVTTQYMPPEQINSETYTEKVDIWALGQIFYLLINGEPMFIGQDQDQINIKITTVKQVQINKSIDSLNCHPYLKNLLKKMILLNSRERLSAQQVKQHVQFFMAEAVHLNNIFQIHRQDEEKEGKLMLKEQQKEQILMQLNQEKEQEIKLKQEELIQENIESFSQKQNEQCQVEIDFEVNLVFRSLEEEYLKGLADQEEELKKHFEKQKQQIEYLLSQDIFKYNQEIMKLEIWKQHQIEKIKQEQYAQYRQKLQDEEDSKKKIIEQKFGSWQSHNFKDLKDQISDKYQKKYEEKLRVLQQQWLEEQQKIIQNKKITLQQLMINVNAFLNNHIQIMNQKKIEIEANANNQEMQSIMILIEQFLQNFQSKLEQFQTEYQQLDQFNEDQLTNLINQYEIQFQLIINENTQQNQIIADLYSQIYQQQIINELKRRELQNQINIKMQQINQKQEQFELMQKENFHQLHVFENQINISTFLTQETVQQLQQISEIHQICKARFRQLNDGLQVQQNDLKNQIISLNIQIYQLDMILEQQLQESQKLAYLQNYYQQQKENYTIYLQEKKQHLLCQCQIYLEQAQTVYQYQTKLYSIQIQQLYNQVIQEINKLQLLNEQIEQLTLSLEFDKQFFTTNEKSLQFFEIEIEQRNTFIKDFKTQLLIAYQEEREACKIKQKCIEAYTQILSQNSLQETFYNYSCCLDEMQRKVQVFNNSELNKLIQIKTINIKNQETDLQKFKKYMSTILFSGTIRTEEQFQQIMEDFTKKIQNLKNNFDSEISAIKELEYRVDQCFAEHKSQIDQEISQIYHSLKSTLSMKIDKHEKAAKYLKGLNKLKSFEILKEGALASQFQILENKLKNYEMQLEEIQKDQKILENEKNLSSQIGFQEQQKIKMKQLEKISNSIVDYQGRLRQKIGDFTQLQAIQDFNHLDILKLQQKLLFQIENEEKQIHNYQTQLDHMKNLLNQSNQQEILANLKSLAQQPQIETHQNYEEWQGQIQILIGIKSQFQLFRCYNLQSDLFDLERMCQRRFSLLTSSNKKNNAIQYKRNQDLNEILEILKMIEECQQFLNQSAKRLYNNQYIDIDLIESLQNSEVEINKNRQSLENALKQKNLVKFRGAIKNQDLIKKIQKDFMPNLEVNKMKIFELLTNVVQQQNEMY